MKKILIIILLLVSAFQALNQSDEFKRILQIRMELEALSVDIIGLNEEIATKVTDGSLGEFLKNIGQNYGLNINVNQRVQEIKVNHSFAQAKILDVLVLLCKEHTLDLDITGTIISVRKYDPPKSEKIVVVREPKVDFNRENLFLSVDLKRDSLFKVAQKITRVTGRNVIFESNVEGKLLSSFIQNRPFEEVLNKIAETNELELKKDGEFFVFVKRLETNNRRNSTALSASELDPEKESQEAKEKYQIDLEGDLINISAKDTSIEAIIIEACYQLDLGYIIQDELEGNVSIEAELISFEKLLSYLFKGTEFGYIQKDNFYLIAKDASIAASNSGKASLQVTEIIQLKNRTIENVLSSNISNGNGLNRNGRGADTNNPSSNNNSINRGRSLGNNFSGGQISQLFQGIEIIPFSELNSFIVKGPYSVVESFKEFINQIDQVVPVVVIDVIIVDVNKNKTISAGVQAGIGEATSQTNGAILGDSGNNGASLDLSTQDINGLINSFNGLGLVNLGNVTPNFYLSLQALETDGVLRSKDNVKLATLNSYPTEINAGSTEYYLETTTNVSASAGNNLVTEQQNWIPLDASLTVQITPVVSGDEQVTLQVLVSQSSFTERAGGDNGPFGSVTRDFSSNIRVKNGDMVLLGGLEDKTITNSGGGLPFLSRIPILRWIFGNRTKTNSKSQLNVFIKPTVMY